MKGDHKTNSEHRSVLPVVTKEMGNTHCKKCVIFPGKSKSNSVKEICSYLIFPSMDFAKINLSLFVTHIVYIIFVIVSDTLYSFRNG